MKQQKHTVEVAKHEIEIEEDLELHEKGWVIQRIGWIFIVTVMVAGGIGTFGNGPVSNQSLAVGDITAEYDRFYPFETEMKISITSKREHISSISLPQNYLNSFRVIRFIPEPINNHTSKGNVTYNFLPGDNLNVCLYMITQRYGSTEGLMTINDSTSIQLKHFIYP